ncbi:C-type mannose receptor 2-like isoform X2 [Salarias fasciatus]|nr:C-type mannose receptor 2-like isoform X1 [Salarias fasciatus]XP_029958718.1 C-type mannose receptor 2-like isoform X2 [Salarias fasciatus]
MDEAHFMTLLLTGFLVSTTSSEQEIIFVEEPMAWEKANDYCFQNSWDLVQIRDEETATALKILSEGLTGSAWIGLYENYSSWNWVDGTELGYINWASGHVMKGTELCASVKDDGTWISSVCTETKTSICFDGRSFRAIQTESSWIDAVMGCDQKRFILAKIESELANYLAGNQVTGNQSWIGLSRPALWHWSENEEALGNYQTWNVGEPVSPETSPPPEEKGCAVVSLTNGSWSRQPCINKHPFFCSTEKIVEMQKTLVRITIQSNANMADPVLRANLKRQLHSEVSQHTSDKIKMSWFKRPEKVQEKTAVKDEC